MNIHDPLEPSHMLAIAALLIEMHPHQSMRLISTLRAILGSLSLHTDTNSNPSIAGLCSQLSDTLDESEANLGSKGARAENSRSNTNGSH